jgi:hypothetical protein
MQVINLIMQFSSFIGSNIFRSVFFLTCTQEIRFPYCQRPSSIPYKTTEKTIVFVYFNFSFDFNPLEPSGYYMYHQP